MCLRCLLRLHSSQSTCLVKNDWKQKKKKYYYYIIYPSYLPNILEPFQWIDQANNCNTPTTAATWGQLRVLRPLKVFFHVSQSEIVTRTERVCLKCLKRIREWNSSMFFFVLFAFYLSQSHIWGEILQRNLIWLRYELLQEDDCREMSKSWKEQFCKKDCSEDFKPWLNI